MECYKCEAVISTNLKPPDGEVFGYPCDTCKNNICKNCANISSTEIRAIPLKERTLIFKCPDCILAENGIYQKLEHMDSELVMLRDLVSNINSGIKSLLNIVQVQNQPADGGVIAKIIEPAISKVIEDKLSNICSSKGFNSNPLAFNATFAEVVAKNTVIVKPKDPSQSNNITKSQLLQKVNLAVNDITVSRVKTISNGGIAVDCSSKLEADKFKNLIAKELPDKLTVKDATKLNPRLRLSGLSVNYSTEEIQHYLLKQNQKIFSTNQCLKVLEITTCRNNKTLYQCLFQTDLVTYNNIMKESFLFISYDHCPVYDAIEVKRCFNCCGFNHFSSKCNKPVVCPRCAKNHKINECKEVELKCVNCCIINKNSSDNVRKEKSEHAAWDRSCPVYIQKCKALKLT